MKSQEPGLVWIAMQVKQGVLEIMDRSDVEQEELRMGFPGRHVMKGASDEKRIAGYQLNSIKVRKWHEEIGFGVEMNCDKWNIGDELKRWQWWHVCVYGLEIYQEGYKELIGIHFAESEQ